MYGKIFDTIFKSTLVTEGGWLPTYIFMSMITLADKDGIVNVSLRTLYNLIGFREYDSKITLDDFKSAIDYLEDKDPESNSPDEEGRRIIPLKDIKEIPDNRGWFIVNHEKYKEKASRYDKQESNTERVRKFRKRKKEDKNDSCNAHVMGGNAHVMGGNALERNVNAKNGHIDIDTDTDIDINNSLQNYSPEGAPQSSEPPVLAIQLIHSSNGVREEYPIYQKDIDGWKESYPAVDVLQSLRNLKEWNLSNPSKNKTRKGIRRHITTWLAREQDRGGSRSQPTLSDTPNQKTVLSKNKSQMYQRFISRYKKPLSQSDEELVADGLLRLKTIWKDIHPNLTRINSPSNFGQDQIVDMLFDDLDLSYMAPKTFTQGWFWEKVNNFLIENGYKTQEYF